MSNTDFTPDTAKITDLRLDQANPRIGKKPDQKSCIEAILESKNFINLVNHVAENGLGLAPIVAYKNPADSKLIVMDGNRRVTALKLLISPALAKGHSKHQKIIQASDSAKKSGNLPTNNKISVYTTTDLPAIHNHMRLTHTGELSGVGQKNWTAMAQALFAIEQGIDDDNLLAACLAVFARDEFGFSFDEEFFVTILTRLINQDRLKELNLKYENHKVSWIQKDGQVEKIILKIVTDIRDQALSTNDVFTPALQREYLDTIFKSFNYSPASSQNNSNTTTTAASNTSPPVSGNPTQQPPPSPTPAGTPTQTPSTTPLGTRKGRTPKKQSWDRKHVIHRGKHPFDFSAHPDKLSNLYIELTKLDLDGSKGTPISAAFAIRAFIELAVEHYRSKHSTGGKGLAQRAENAAVNLHTQNKISSDLKLLVTRYASANSFLSIGSLQKYLHSTSFHPNKQYLNTLWDDLYPFLVECLKG